jgi:hypothetical protein
LRVGTRVDVHTRYEPGRWTSGFNIAAVRPDGYLIRRASDGVVLSETIRPEEVRVVSRVPQGWTNLQPGPTIPKTPTEAALGPSDALILESCHSTWIFDPQRRKFRRIIKGVEVGHRCVMTEWRTYWQLVVDPEGEGFTVYLNSSRSRLIRSWRHTQHCARCEGSAGDLSPHDSHDTAQRAVADARERSPA